MYLVKCKDEKYRIVTVDSRIIKFVSTVTGQVFTEFDKIKDIKNLEFIEPTDDILTYKQRIIARYNSENSTIKNINKTNPNS